MCGLIEGEKDISEGYKIYQTNNFIKKIKKGELNIENFRNMIQELAAASAVHKNHNLLIDIREITPINGFGEILKIIIEATKYYHAFRNKIALIIANEPDRIARTKFFKAGLKLGNYQFEYFTDYENALDWLSDIQERSKAHKLST